jgi:hypothetical protein
MAELRLRLLSYLTPASKNQVEPNSGCRQGGDITTNLATALCHSLLSVTHPRPRCSTETSRRRTYGSATAPSSSVPNACKQESGSTQLGVPTRWRFHLKPRHCLLSLSPIRRPPKTSELHRNGSSSDVRQRYGSVFVRALHLQAKIRLNPAQGADKGAISQKKLATALGLSSLSVAYLRPRCSTKTSRRRTYSSATVPSSSVPYTCKQESGSTQLGVPTWGRFHNKPSRCPLTLSPSRRPLKTTLLYQSESSSGAR